jgi:branched-chain amino acid transport system ATP-binding protein
MPHDAPRPLLDVAGIAAGYRRLQVLWGVDLVVHEHESVVLLGANGAGKTTLLKAIMSLVEVWAGRIDFADENITRLGTDQRVQRGIVFMSETSGFPGLTVEENVLIGAQFLPANRARGRIDELFA